MSELTNGEAAPTTAGLSVASAHRLSVLHAETYLFPAPWSFPAAELPYSMVRLVLAGTGEMAFDGHRYELIAGDLVLIPEGAVLECRSTSMDFTFSSIRFAVSASAPGLLPSALPVPAYSGAGMDPIVRDNVEAVISAWDRATPGRILLSTGHLAVALGRAADIAPLSSAQAALPERRLPARIRDPRIARVIEYLAHNLASSPDVHRLCDLAHMSESTLRRTFKEHTGKTIGEYVRELRMGVAARRLAFDDAHIGQIAADVGMPDANYFARSFREVFRLSPSEYRKLAKET